MKLNANTHRSPRAAEAHTQPLLFPQKEMTLPQIKHTWSFSFIQNYLHSDNIHETRRAADARGHTSEGHTLATHTHRFISRWVTYWSHRRTCSNPRKTMTENSSVCVCVCVCVFTTSNRYWSQNKLSSSC